MNNLTENIILIPIYNEWKSLNKLLLEINHTLSNDDLYTNLNKINEIKILSLKENLGSQKCIAIGLDYLMSLKNNCYITIMDGDGEDDPSEIKKMLNSAKINEGHIITSCRKDRNEKFIIKLSYKIHLIISLFFTWQWISFGNFSCFNSKNLKKINLFEVWFAYSAGVLKKCKIKKIYASRKKRYFDNSKVNFFKLIEHSFRIISVFYRRMLTSSLILILIVWVLKLPFSYLFYASTFIINLIVILIKLKHSDKIHKNLNSYIEEIKTI